MLRAYFKMRGYTPRGLPSGRIPSSSPISGAISVILKWPLSVRPGRRVLQAAIATLGLSCLPAQADQVSICYNYGCNAKAEVTYDAAQLEYLRQTLAAAGDAAGEREAVSRVIGRMYAIAGEQTPVWRDRAGNFADGGEDGQMDCIDHSTTTTAFLRLLQGKGWLRYHEVLEPLMRRLYIFAVHWAARIRDTGAQQDYMVDSWYVDNGRPALVFLEWEWLTGKHPDGS
jgi:hypothetical protein